MKKKEKREVEEERRRSQNHIFSFFFPSLFRRQLFPENSTKPPLSHHNAPLLLRRRAPRRDRAPVGHVLGRGERSSRGEREREVVTTTATTRAVVVSFSRIAFLCANYASFRFSFASVLYSRLFLARGRGRRANEGGVEWFRAPAFCFFFVVGAVGGGGVFASFLLSCSPRRLLLLLLHNNKTGLFLGQCDEREVLLF